MKKKSANDWLSIAQIKDFDYISIVGQQKLPVFGRKIFTDRSGNINGCPGVNQKACGRYSADGSPPCRGKACTKCRLTGIRVQSVSSTGNSNRTLKNRKYEPTASFLCDFGGRKRQKIVALQQRKTTQTILGFLRNGQNLAATNL
ncbi:MAG: hypothetical protein PUK16_02335 [Prevotellaceae bacterium]|nr:hypothetical protein [Prevotellaceae bacterium]